MNPSIPSELVIDVSDLLARLEEKVTAIKNSKPAITKKLPMFKITGISEGDDRARPLFWLK